MLSFASGRISRSRPCFTSLLSRLCLWTSSLVGWLERKGLRLDLGAIPKLRTELEATGHHWVWTMAPGIDCVDYRAESHHISIYDSLLESQMWCISHVPPRTCKAAARKDSGPASFDDYVSCHKHSGRRRAMLATGQAFFHGPSCKSSLSTPKVRTASVNMQSDDLTMHVQ